MSRPTVFISYSHKDQRMLRTLSPYLQALQRQSLAEIWNDAELKGGDRWREEIEAALDSAAIAVLLISQEFLASKFIYEEELPRIFRRQREGQLAVLPVFLSPSTVTSTSITFVGSDGIQREVALNEFQGFGTPEKTIKELQPSERDRLFLRLHDRVKELAASRYSSSNLPLQPTALGGSNRGSPTMVVTPEAASNVTQQNAQAVAGDEARSSVSKRVILDRHYAYTLTSYATDVNQRGSSALLPIYDELFDVLTCSILLFEEIYIEQHHVSSLEFRLNERESASYSRLFTPFSLFEPVSNSTDNLATELQIRRDLSNTELIPLIASYYGRKSIRPEHSKELLLYVNKILEWAGLWGSCVFVRPSRMPLFRYKLRSMKTAESETSNQRPHVLLQVPVRRYCSLDQLESIRDDPARQSLCERLWREIKLCANSQPNALSGAIALQSPELIAMPKELTYHADYFRNFRIEISKLYGNVCFFLVPERE